MYNSAVKFLEETARKFPTKTAIIDNEESINYRDYQKYAITIGNNILNKFDVFKKNRTIAIFLPKGLNVLVSFMGVMYSGNMYIPLDTTMPEKRLVKIFDNLNPEMIITDSKHMKILEKLGIEEDKITIYDDLIQGDENREKVDHAINQMIDTDPIYIMYTSGSTGNPKGVVIPHKGVMDYIFWLEEKFDVTESEIIGNQSPFYFDNTVLDVYLSLKAGATLIIIPDVFFQFQSKVLEYINEMKISLIFWVPTIYINLANTNLLPETPLPYLKKALFCGEVMPNKQLNMWRKAYTSVIYANLYGPTEITDVCTYYIIDRDFEDSEPLPIGIPCENTNILILGEGNEVKKGEVGELCILGTGLSLGYYGEKEITDKVFMQNPLQNKYLERIYLTGDLVYEKDGLIMFAGRKDSQIKHRGNRIELGEIEVAAKSLPEVLNACVLYDNEKSEIVLFLEIEEEVNLNNIKRKLLGLVPKYMLPQVINKMEKFPYTANSKIDRVKLKEML